MKCKQLFCSIPTSLVSAQMLDNPFDPAVVPAENRYNNGFSLISLLHEESMDYCLWDFCPCGQILWWIVACDSNGEST